ncbi:MAG: branched-chain amino acid ABC transporter permease [Actinobacteria bacterium]|nr:branched-chain amino acid ABC transporter permease [Actinomycetota bacterium]
MSKDKRKSLARVLWLPFALGVILLIAYLVARFLLGTEYERIATNMFILAVVVVGFQIFSGNSGVLSFGHVAFMAVGAYVSALLTIPSVVKEATFTEMPSFLHWILSTNVGFIPAVLIGGVCAAILAIIAAPAIVRLAGVPAGIATLALLVIVYTFTIQTDSITRGTSTMIGVPESTTMTNAFIWALIAVGVALIYQATRAGMRLRASRENFPAARSVGIRPAWDRSLAWVM